MNVLKLVLSLLLILSVNAQAATFYVAPTGQAGCSTNTNSPQGGLSNGVACLSGGDTLVLKNGTYNGNIFAGALPNGPSNAVRTIVRAENFRQAIIAPDANEAFSLENQQNITLDGVVLDGRNIACGIGHLETAQVTNVLITGVEIKNLKADDQGTNQSFCTTNAIGAGGETNSNAILRNLYIHDIGTNCAGIGSCCNECYAYPIYLSGNNYIVEDSLFVNASGWILHGFTGNPNGANNNIIRRNTFDTGGGPVLLCQSNNQIYNNVIRNVGTIGVHVTTGIQIAGSCAGQTSNNNFVANNTIFGTPGDCIHSGYSTNGVYRNNICWNNNNDTIVIGTGSGNAVSNNHCGTAGSTGGCSTIGNPNFVNQSTGDFHLTAGSSAATGGVNLALNFTTDKDGNTRFDPWTRGAYCINCSGQPPPPGNPTTIWLTFEEGFGTTATDETRNGNTATLQGSTLPTWTSVARLGRFALHFNNVGDYASVVIGSFRTNFTIAMSLKADDTIAGNPITYPFFGEYSLSNGEVSFNWDNPNVAFRQSFVIGEGSAIYNPCKYVSALTNNTYYRLVLTYDGTNMRCYLNGALEATVPSNPPNGDLINLWLNRASYSPGWRGTLDDFIIDNTVWNQTLITSDFNKAFNPTPIGPTHGGH